MSSEYGDLMLLAKCSELEAALAKAKCEVREAWGFAREAQANRDALREEMHEQHHGRMRELKRALKAERELDTARAGESQLRAVGPFRQATVNQRDTDTTCRQSSWVRSEPMSSDITILETDGPDRRELSIEVKARSVGVSIWDNDDYKVVWFDMTSPEHRSALRGMVEVLQHQLSAHEEDGQ